MSITSWTATGGDWEDPAFERAWDGPAISPDKGNITLSASAPVGKLEFFASPDTANLELLQSYEWDQLTTSWITTPGTWTTGPVPEVAVGTNASVDKADLTFTAYAPETGIFYKFVITAPTLTLTGKLPIAGDGFVITPDNATLTVLQTFAWNTYGGTWANASTAWDDVAFTPTAVETGQNQPDAGSLSLTGSVPDFRLSQLWYVPSGSMALTGFLPLSTTGHMFYPDTVSLTGLGTTSWGDTTGDWSSSSDAWGEGTLSPTAGVTYTFTIDSSGNLVFKPYDLSWPQIGQPKYIPGVIII